MMEVDVEGWLLGVEEMINKACEMKWGWMMLYKDHSVRFHSRW